MPPEQRSPDSEPDPIVFVVFSDGRPTLALDYRSVDLTQEILDARAEYRAWLQSCCKDGVVFSD